MNKTQFSFDGKGINLKSEEYAPRVATFAQPEYADKFGALLEAAPELLEAARRVLARFSLEYKNGEDCLHELEAAIVAANGRK